MTQNLSYHRGEEKEEKEASFSVAALGHFTFSEPFLRQDSEQANDELSRPISDNMTSWNSDRLDKLRE